MRARKQSKLALIVSASLVAGVIAVLNVGGPLTVTQAATACRGGDGGGSPSPTSTSTSTSTGTSSPSETETGPLPISPLNEPVAFQTTNTESPSPSESDTGPLPTLPTILPSESESSGSPSGTQSSPPDEQPRQCSTEITIKHRDRRATESFSGRVRSEESQCVRARPVSVKKATKGADKTVGRTRTNQRGKYSVNVKNAKGRYYAVAKKKRTETDEGTTTCRPDRSPKVRG